jgi:hypothetical protein
MKLNKLLKGGMHVDFWTNLEDQCLRFRVKFLGVEIVRIKVTLMDHNIIHVDK